MSDSDNQEAQVDVPEEEEELDIFEAVQQVLKKAKHSDGLSIGINEAARAIDRGDARLCFLADNCDNKDYKNLVTALCAEKGIKVFKVSSRETLGEWAGLCKYDFDGTARKTVKCSCVAITNTDEDSAAFRRVVEYTDEQH